MQEGPGKETVLEDWGPPGKAERTAPSVRAARGDELRIIEEGAP